MVFIILIVIVILGFNNFCKKSPITHVWLGSKHTKELPKIITLSTNNLRIIVNIDNFGETFFLDHG